MPSRARLSSFAQTAAALFLWYALSGLFTVANKRLLNAFGHPWFVSWFQLATGVCLVVPTWALGFRRAPLVDVSTLRTFGPIAGCHALGHALQIAGLRAGSVYFSTVIKATEPLIATLVTFVATGKQAPWFLNLSFLPIIGGVACATAKPGASADLSDLVSFAACSAFGSTILFAIAKVLTRLHISYSCALT